MSPSPMRSTPASVKVLFLSVGAQPTLQLAYDEFLAAIGDRHPVELYRPTEALAEQLEAVKVVVDLGGWATREMIDAGRAAGVELWQVLGYGLDHINVSYVLKRSLLLAHTPGVYRRSLAEHALFLMLCVEEPQRTGKPSQDLCKPFGGGCWETVVVDSERAARASDVLAQWACGSSP